MLDNESFDKRIKEIITTCIELIENFQTQHQDKSIFLAYSWLDYSILLIRIKSYNFIEQIDKKVIENYRKKNKMSYSKDYNKILEQVKESLKNTDVTKEKNVEKTIEKLREARDVLKVITKRLRNKKRKEISEKNKKNFRVN
ncbi:MAG: hypothetical protein ACPKPY_10230 [Nitrososphaeraceae archaeon]